MRFHLVRLGLYLAAVAGVVAVYAGGSAPVWFVLVMAACPAVVLSPVLLLSLEGIARERRWGRFQHDAVRAAELTGPRTSRRPTRPRGWQGGRPR